MKEAKIYKGVLVNYFKFKFQGRFMPKVIEAVYENGVFKPLEKVDVEKGEKLKIVIKMDISNLKGKYGRREKSKLLELRDEIYDRRSHIRR